MPICVGSLFLVLFFCVFDHLALFVSLYWLIHQIKASVVAACKETPPCVVETDAPKATSDHATTVAALVEVVSVCSPGRNRKLKQAQN